MTNMLKIGHFYKVFKLSCIALLITMFYSPASYAADIMDCGIKTSSSGNIIPECPNGSIRRDDINVSCMIRQAARNTCVDVMPVQNKGGIVRIPEDVCHRGAGWGNPRNHNGMDYAVGEGSTLVAAADGRVIVASNCEGKGNSGNGRHVIIQHEMAPQSGQGGAIVDDKNTRCFQTLYLHMSKVTARVGPIKKGDPIGSVGGTGCRGSAPAAVYPPHLHFEMRFCKGYAPINPMCPGIGDLCPKYESGNQEKFDPDSCKDCSKNPALCEPGNFSTYDPGVGGAGGGGDGYSELSANDKNCSISNYRDSVKICMFCEIFRVLFDTASGVASLSFKALAPAVQAVVIIATAIWIAFTILKYISSFEVKEPRQMIKELLNQIIIVMFVIIILAAGPQEFFNYTLGPIFNTGMKLAIFTSTQPELMDCDGFTVRTLAEGGGLPEEMGKNILCVVKAIQDSFLDILALGSAAMCIGFFEESFWGIPIFPHFGYVLTGLALWVAAILILIIYPWLLVDSVLKLCVSVSLLPAAIGSFAFKSTRKYSNIVWETFLNSMFTFMFLTIILFVLIKMIDGTLAEADVKSLMSDSTSHESILDKIGWWTGTFLQVLFAILLGWAVLDEGQSFADTFSGGWKMGPIGSSVGTLAMSGVKGAATPVAKAAGKAGKAAATAVGRTVSEKANQAKINRQARNITNSRHSTVDANGNITQSYTSWTGKQVTRTLNVDANGNKSITKTKTDSKGNSKTTTNDKFMSVTVTKDKNGNITGQQFDMKAAGTKYMVNKDGSINQVAVNAMLQNSLHDKETVYKAVAMQITKERFGVDKTMNRDFASQKVMIGQNEKGETVVNITQKNKDGTMQRIDMALGEKNAMVSVENVSKKGQASMVSSDGIIKKSSSYQYTKDGVINEKTRKTNYCFEKFYNKENRAIDSLGKLAKWVPQDKIMYSEADMQALTKQVAKYGRPKDVELSPPSDALTARTDFSIDQYYKRCTGEYPTGSGITVSSTTSRVITRGEVDGEQSRPSPSVTIGGDGYDINLTKDGMVGKNNSPLISRDDVQVEPSQLKGDDKKLYDNFYARAKENEASRGATGEELDKGATNSAKLYFARAKAREYNASPESKERVATENMKASESKDFKGFVGGYEKTRVD